MNELSFILIRKIQDVKETRLFYKSCVINYYCLRLLNYQLLKIKQIMVETTYPGTHILVQRFQVF